MRFRRAWEYEAKAIHKVAKEELMSILDKLNCENVRMEITPFRWKCLTATAEELIENDELDPAYADPLFMADLGKKVVLGAE